ncbi:hypothetical protein BKA83DRAFT_4129389 [Pisolithus microcarpus]|nr:hypothetical protein BKA83DRAFT_4129389 [Pisolithus microcarpus]
MLLAASMDLSRSGSQAPIQAIPSILNTLQSPTPTEASRRSHIQVWGQIWCGKYGFELENIKGDAQASGHHETNSPQAISRATAIASTGHQTASQTSPQVLTKKPCGRQNGKRALAEVEAVEQDPGSCPALTGQRTQQNTRQKHQVG